MQGRDFNKVVNVFCSDKLASFTASNIHRIQKGTKAETPKQDGGNRKFKTVTKRLK